MHVTNCFLPLRRPCPGVVTIHDLAFEAWPEDFHPRTRLKYRLIAPRAARSAELVICPSLFTRDDVCERYGVDPGRVRVIPEAPALPLAGARPGGPSHPGSAAPYVLAVGDLRAKKNLASLVRAFAELSRAGTVEHRLILAGVDTGEGPRLHELAGEASVELTGYVSDEALDGLIRGADLLVNPSLYEGFGLVILEAMARSTPVLAARAGALPEAGGDAAAYYDPADPAGLIAALDELLGDPAARERIAARGREWVARFSWARTARETLGRLFGARMNATILLLSVDEAPLLAYSLPAAVRAAAQAGAAVDVVVVDNGSSDETGALAAEHGARHLRLEPRRSYAAAINQAVAQTAGDAVLLLNADCLLDDGFLAAALPRLEAEPRVGSVAPKLLRMRAPGVPLDEIDAAGMYVDHHRKNGLVGHGRPAAAFAMPAAAFGADGAAALYRRETLLDCALDGGEVLDEDFQLWASDADLAWRARLLGWECVYEPAAVGRSHPHV